MSIRYESLVSTPGRGAAELKAEMGHLKTIHSALARPSLTQGGSRSPHQGRARDAWPQPGSWAEAGRRSRPSGSAGRGRTRGSAAAPPHGQALPPAPRGHPAHPLPEEAPGPVLTSPSICTCFTAESPAAAALPLPLAAAKPPPAEPEPSLRDAMAAPARPERETRHTGSGGAAGAVRGQMAPGGTRRGALRVRHCAVPPQGSGLAPARPRGPGCSCRGRALCQVPCALSLVPRALSLVPCAGCPGPCPSSPSMGQAKRAVPASFPLHRITESFTLEKPSKIIEPSP